VNASGKRSIVFSRNEGLVDCEVIIPCGSCIGCRLEKSRQWAIRCIHEASLYDNNCFITLTYNNEHLPHTRSLIKRDFVLFMKRLRKQFGQGIRFFQSGEYGDQLSRPHYHACLFNFTFKDKEELFLNNSKDVKLYRSATLEKLWPYGFSTIGDVTFESAAYVARYCTKKITGEKADEHYGFSYGWNKDGEFVKRPRVREYCSMSRRPGLGSKWFDKFKSDCFPHDEVVVKGFPSKVPRYYDEKFNIDSGIQEAYTKIINDVEFEIKELPSKEFLRLKALRKRKAGKHKNMLTLDRLAIKEEVRRKVLKLFERRSYETSNLCST